MCEVKRIFHGLVCENQVMTNMSWYFNSKTKFYLTRLSKNGLYQQFTMISPILSISTVASLVR